MSDNLRDRIADVLVDAFLATYVEQAKLAADAIIAALEADYTLAPKDKHDNDRRLFKDGVWGCGEPNCKVCY